MKLCKITFYGKIAKKLLKLCKIEISCPKNCLLVRRNFLFHATLSFLKIRFGTFISFSLYFGGFNRLNEQSESFSIRL